MAQYSQWLSNDESRQRVRTLLEKAGTPLELRTWREANSASELYSSDDRLFNSNHIVYEPSSGHGALREVDLCSMVYEEVSVDDHLGVQLILRIPIECKHREEVEYFGFPEPPGRNEIAQFPIVTSLVGSDLARLLPMGNPKQLRPSVMSVFPLKIRQGSTPEQPTKEDVVFKAGAALYDFIESTLAEASDDAANELSEIQPVLDRFESYLGDRRYAWWSVLHRWKRDNIGQTEAQRFAQFVTGGHRVYTSVTLWLPLVCVDSPLYEVSVRSDATPDEFTPVDFLSTRLRTPGWPRCIRGLGINVTPEVPLIVTNPSGLATVYEHAIAWFDDLKKVIAAADDKIVERAWVESAFCRAVRRRYDNPSEPYSSEFDIERFV